MLRHSCGFHLAEQGIPAYDIKSYLGHRNIQSTDRYIAASKHRFKKITWD
jgi:site-specific recombinase XerD